MTRRLPIALGLSVLGACGGTAVATSTPYQAPSTSFSARHHRTVIGSTWNPGYDYIAVGPHRHALYMFCIHSSVRCPGHHSPNFPPLIAHGRVVAASHSLIRASKLGTVKLKNGRWQVTYYGHPLYVYRGDHKSGKSAIHGESKDHDRWELVDPATGGRALSAAY